MRKDHIDIVYEDKEIIVVNKRENLLTIATEKEKTKTLFHNVLLYLKTKNKNNRVFIVHRLDYETSGLIVFAKSECVKKTLQDNWEETKRKYIAILEGNVNKASGTIKSWLKETKTLITYSSPIKDNGKLAITKYEIMKKNDKYSLVNISLLTGRKNQIRVHMKEIKHPIVGDKKYGNGTKSDKRMYLHAYFLEFKHPIRNKIMTFELPIPREFNKLI